MRIRPLPKAISAQCYELNGVRYHRLNPYVYFIWWRGWLGKQLMLLGAKWTGVPYTSTAHNDGELTVVIFSSIPMSMPAKIVRTGRGFDPEERSLWDGETTRPVRAH